VRAVLARSNYNKQDALRSVNSLGLYKTHITVHDTYSTQLFQLRFKVFPELLKRKSRIEYERERLNTVLKCGRPYWQKGLVQVKLYLVRYILFVQDCQPIGPYARIKLRFKTFKIKYFGAFGLKILSKWRKKWDESTGIRPKKRKPMIPKLWRIKRIAFFIIERFVNKYTISLGFPRQRP
jgi:hypothetical protein